MKKFKGFTNQQTHTLLKEMGYTGPAQKDDMDAFLASSPSAASKLGRYTEIAKQRVEGGPLSGMGMAEGGSTFKRRNFSNREDDGSAGDGAADIEGLIRKDGYSEVSRIAPKDTPLTDTRMVGSPLDEQGRPELRTVTKPGEQVTQIPPPEGAQVLKPGTPTPETTQPSIDLDAAQKAYSDAMGALTDAQLAIDPAQKELIDAQEALSKIPTEFDAEEYLKQNPDVANHSVWGKDPLGHYNKYGKEENRTYPEKAAAGSEEEYNAAKALVDEKQGALDTATKAIEDAELLVTQTQADVATKQKQFETTDIPSTAEALGKAISSPSSILAQPTVYGLKVENNQLIDEDTGQVATAATLLVKQAQAADAVEDPKVKATMAYLDGLTDAQKQEKYSIPAGATASDIEAIQARIEQDAIADRAETYKSVVSQPKVEAALADLAAATGVPSDEALMKAETMNPDELSQLGLDAETLDTIRQIPEIKRQLDAGEIPTAALFDEYTKAEAAEFEGEVEEIDPAKFETETPKAEAEVDYNLPPTEIAEIEKTKVEDAAKFDEYATADEKKSEFVPDVTAEETTVGTDEIVDVNKIINSEEVIVAGKTLEALNEASTAKAATATFTQQLAAKAVKGEVSAASTVQFQMEKLMKSFDNGTPAWAAGALRKANAAMSARGLGNSSMASAAIIQATLESAIPIAQQDAATFAAMDMENVRNEQAVALANAAAAQNFELANLSNEQAVRIQNSMNNANLQLKNLSNEQEAVLATAQFKAALQGQELSISANVALANAARYAAVNDINLTNRQQTSILKSTQNLEVEMANLSNAQQTALSNLQVKAAMMGQELSNEQQMAVLESTQAFEANMQDATMKQQAFIQDAVARAAMEGRVLDNKQQTALFNVANVVAERGIELNNEQQTAIFNMSNKLQVDMAEMSNRQQTALANAQIEAAMKGQELTNKQQVNVIKAERIAEVANMNFTAEQTRALRNSEMAMSVDLANLTNKQAKLMADVAAMADVDMANLNNRQQAAAQQAQAFLQMDMANLDNEQQAVMFEAQSLVQSIFSDQAAENAQLQFNAESINQVNQFYEGLTTQINQFNVAQANAMEQFNAGEENTMTKFQAELDNQRDMFNAQNELVIAQANTVWRQTVATANTAALNEANMAEVMAANNLTMQGLAELWQQERDLMDFAWRSANNQLERDHQLLVQKIANDNAEDSERGKAAGNLVSSLFNAALDIGKAYVGKELGVTVK